MSTSKNAAAKRKPATTTKNGTSSLSRTSTRKTTEEEVKNQTKATKSKLLEDREVTKKKVLDSSSTDKNVLAKKPSSEKGKEPAKKPRTGVPAASPRIQKSQYFPSKNLYSNALKSLEMQQKIRESPRTVTELKSKTTSLQKKTAASSSPKTIPKKLERTIPKESSKKNQRDSSPETTSSNLDRPRTATLKKGKIVNANLVGPKAPTAQSHATKETEGEETYEEDFESYESDFEAATSSSEETSALLISGASGSMSTSTEDMQDKPELTGTAKRLSSAESDERKLDSGTFELTDFKHRQILKYIEDVIKKEDAIIEQQPEKCAHHSLSDEGFEDQRSLQFINFADAKKKCEKRRASAARKKRGDELLSMIKLDAMNFTIFDSPSVPYEVFIKNYGQCCTVQASVQTGEDNVNEELQTDNVGQRTIWTQMPGKFSAFNDSVDGFWENYISERLGVGQEVKSAKEISVSTNESHLEVFLKHTSDLVLQILSEEKLSHIEKLKQNKTELPFSRGYLQLNTTGGLLKETTVQTISVHPGNIGKILTVHSNNNINFDPMKSIVCIWDLANLDAPSTTLASFGDVTCAAFYLGDDDSYIMAGQNEGALCVWNIKKRPRIYDMVTSSPSFVTPIGSGHLSKVVALQMVCHNKGGGIELGKIYQGNEVLSLDDSGKVVIWTLYPNKDPAEASKDVTLINSQVIDLRQIYPQLAEFICTDCLVLDNHLYVSTNHGFILHCLVSGKPGITKTFHTESKSEATCLESCPFSSSHFLAGYSNGDLKLFSNTTDRPLLVLQNKDQIDNSEVQIIQWSKTKPFLFYAKDSRNAIHVWDLSKSDMYPEYSVHFPEKINCLKLSPAVNMGEKDDEMAYMLIGTSNGNIYMHLLQKDEGKNALEQYNKDVQVFLNYLSRL